MRDPRQEKLTPVNQSSLGRSISMRALYASLMLECREKWQLKGIETMAKKSELPPCSDFIIAAVRQLRYERPSMKPGTQPGVGMWKAYGVAVQRYSDKEVRKALNELLARETIIIAAEIDSVRRDENTRRRVHGPRQAMLIEKIDAHLPIHRGYWQRDTRGRILPRGKEYKLDEYDSVRSPRIHVVEDGLSQSVEKLIRRAQKAAAPMADQILASMSNRTKK